jgi:hypothetical protein
LSSRQEEKELRKAERLEAEQRENAAGARARRLQMVGGGILVAAVIAVAVILISSGGGSSSSTSGGRSTGGPQAKIPVPANKDLASAAKAAGCTVKTFPVFGQSHVGTPVQYKTNPATSGNHSPVPALDGIYTAANTPSVEHTVHTLEHGRVEIQYRRGTSPHVVAQLTTLFNEPLKGQSGYKTLLFQNQTNMPFAVAATAWSHSIGCPKINPQVWDAIRDFRSTWVDHAPENFPPN